MDPYQDDQSTTTRGSSVEKEHLLEIGSTPKRRRCTIFSLPRIIFLLGLANTVLLSLLLTQALHQHTASVMLESSNPVLQHSHVHSDEVWQPPQSRQGKIFQYDDVYAAEPDGSDAVERLWTKLIPQGKGYIALPNTTILPDFPGLNKSWEGDHRAAMSVFHQLHCLYLTRDGFFASIDGTLSERPLLNTKHLVHCWEYLRQAIMCSADTTLEWIGPDETGTTGWGYEHSCKDFGAIHAWAEERRYRELQTIH